MEKNLPQGKPPAAEPPVQEPAQSKTGYHSLSAPEDAAGRPARLHREYVDAKEEARDWH